MPGSARHEPHGFHREIASNSLGSATSFPPGPTSARVGFYVIMTFTKVTVKGNPLIRRETAEDSRVPSRVAHARHIPAPRTASQSRTGREVGLR